MAIRLGTNPIAWSNDDLRSLGGATPLETCLAEAREAGFEGIELGHKFPRQADTLSEVLGRHGLDLVSGWYSADLVAHDVDREWRAMADHFALLKALGCGVMVVCDTGGAVHGDIAQPLSARPVLAERDWPGFTARLTALADRMAENGLRLAYHHHMGTRIQTEAELDRLMAETGPSVGLLLDAGHLTFAGGDPAAVARRHAGRVIHVHAKDVRREVMDRALADDLSFLEAVVEGVYTVPGDGSVDFAAVLRPLAEAGYAGWLVVEAEQDPEKAHPLTYARLGHDTLARLAREAGFGG